MKIISDRLFDTLVLYRDYCEKQGSTDPLQEVDDILSETKRMWLSIKDIWPTVREVSGPQFIMTIFGAEQIIDKGLSVGMANKKFYKDIFQEVKGKVQIFVDLHGKSSVISEQLLIK